MTRPRILMAAVGAAGLIALVAGCGDSGTVSPNGRVWVITPDVQMHIEAHDTLVTGTGQCGNGRTTWVARSPEVNIASWSQGHTLQVPCNDRDPSGYAVGSWGLESRPA